MSNPSGSGSLSSFKIDKDLTLLLLGETGVGKSTWINGFANFLQYDTLEKAAVSPTIFLVPASFTLSDENYEEKLVAVGADENEVTSVGQSATQQPQTYTFSKDGHTIRLIDTPGIGDVRGVEQDKKNFQQILSHIAHLDVLNGICILLKPNNARLNVMFSFCIKELLANLHRDACRNIVFCFTNSRSTFYRPGDTLPALKKLIAESKNVNMPLNQKTVYCMDNESIRFLYALKEEIPFTPDERQNYANSWDKSVSEVNRLLSYVAGQPPHDVQNTLSLNNARQTVLALSKPLVNITESIQKNMLLAEDKKEELRSSTKSKEELADILFIPKMEVQKEELEEPRTVCTNIKCLKLIKMGGKGSCEIYATEYTQNCHSGCSRGKKKQGEVLGIVGHKAIRKCSAFDRRTGMCKTCGCKWEDHMKTMEVNKVEVIRIVDPELEKQLNEKNTAIEKLEVFLASIDKTLEELRDEQKQITNASAKFACFLKNNAIRPYNDSIIAYLTVCINHERNVQGEVKGQGETLRRLEKMKEVYEEELQLLEKAVREGSDEPVTPEELNDSIAKLCKLKHNGEEFRRYIKSSMAVESAIYMEKKVEVHGDLRIVTTVKIKKRHTSKFAGLFAMKGQEERFETAGLTVLKEQAELEEPMTQPKPELLQEEMFTNVSPVAKSPPSVSPFYSNPFLVSPRQPVSPSGQSGLSTQSSFRQFGKGGSVRPLPSPQPRQYSPVPVKAPQRMQLNERANFMPKIQGMNPFGGTFNTKGEELKEHPRPDLFKAGKFARVIPKGKPPPLPARNPGRFNPSLPRTSGLTYFGGRNSFISGNSPGQNLNLGRGGSGPPPPPPPPPVAPLQLPQGLEVRGRADLMAEIRGGLKLKNVEGEGAKGCAGKKGTEIDALAEAMKKAMLQKRFTGEIKKTVDEDPNLSEWE